eukprot:Skav234329  [mRNA]  locus=scaffold306:29601:30680:- [translate_table: standard]
MDKKRKFNEVVKRHQVSTDKGFLQHAMIAHFREHCNPQAFYSLPVGIVMQLPIQQLDLALCTRLSLKGHSVQPAGALPPTSGTNTLPLEDRGSGAQDSIEDQTALFLGPLQDDGNHDDGCLVATPAVEPRPVVSFNTFGLGDRLQQLAQDSEVDGLVLFRVSDMAPNKKKRPYLQSTDFCVRFYTGIEGLQNDSGIVDRIWTCQGSQSEVPLVQLFMGKNPQETIANMYQWEAQSNLKEDHPEAFLVRRARPAFEMRVGLPCTLATVDADRGFRPTLLELTLLLGRAGWSWKNASSVATSQLKRCIISPDRKIFFQRGFWHCLTLVNLKEILQFQEKVYHGQLEAYYEAIFRLAATGAR